jgi:hypothetical protein
MAFIYYESGKSALMPSSHPEVYGSAWWGYSSVGDLAGGIGDYLDLSLPEAKERLERALGTTVSTPFFAASLGELTEIARGRRHGLSLGSGPSGFPLAYPLREFVLKTEALLPAIEKALTLIDAQHEVLRDNLGILTATRVGARRKSVQVGLPPAVRLLAGPLGVVLPDFTLVMDLDSADPHVQQLATKILTLRAAAIIGPEAVRIAATVRDAAIPKPDTAKTALKGLEELARQLQTAGIQF